MPFSTPLLVFFDTVRLVNSLVAIVLLVGSAAVVMHPMPGIPRRVEGARTVFILGVMCLLLGGLVGNVQRLGQTPTLGLAGNTAGLALLLVWLVREYRAVHHPPEEA